MGDITISVVSRKLTDGSEVFDVHMGDVVINAYSERDACKLADRISRAIDDHSVSSCVISFGEWTR